MVEEDDVRAALQEVYDPEIPVNIVDLGLVYDLDIDQEAKSVHVSMTLTSMGCPIADSIKRNVSIAAESVEGIENATVELVWDPPWSPEKATEQGKAQLESMGIRVPNYDDDGEETASQGAPF
ncbi:MAG: metal-sulfur cluster assembly factor [Halodesulfurarchaeum sp.]